MISIDSRRWNERSILRYVGHLDQLAGIRPVEAADGLGRGNRMFQVWTGSGLSFQVVAERALDISVCQYKGLPLAWISPVGEAHPAFYEPEESGWLRTYGGGLFVTCGLDSFGDPSTDAGEQFGAHGRASTLPARCVGYRTHWVDDAEGKARYELEVAGEVRQARLFGENLRLQRRIVTWLGSRAIRIEDTVTNEGFKPQPHMILYHFNMGFPLVSEDSELLIEATETVPRDEDSRPGLNECLRFQPPTPDYREQVFRHAPVANSDGKVHVELRNPALGLGVRWSYEKAALPHLFEWKQMGEGEYVVGIEPGNSSAIEGRATARQRGDLPHLEPGEVRRYAIDLEVVEYG